MNTIVIRGFAGGFYITKGYGDSSIEPPPTPPVGGEQGAILGSMICELMPHNTHVVMGPEVY